MPVLRKRLTCHYCGKRSGSVKSQGRRFKCDHCLAVNFLDENGEIADVPPEEQSTPKRYTQSVLETQSSIFCSTCLKNQHLYTSALSEFLPDPDDPEYEKYEAALPQFKKSLEERYPQCCAQCEPRVRAQLQQVTYNARSDHVRRMLERSRQRRISNRLGWRSLLVSAAGVGSFASLAIQLVWHGLGSQAYGMAENFSLLNCITRPTYECVDLVEQYVGWSIGLAFLCIWWNPKWQHKLQNNEGRLIGLDRYYRIQFVLLSLRIIAWIAMELPIATKSMFHSMFLVMMIVLSGWSYTVVKVDTTSLVNWQQDPAPLISSSQFVPPSVQPDPEPVSFSAFAPPAQQDLQPWQPPTPEEDMMDWTPSQTSFQPQPKQLKVKQPTPFYGTLPALPRGRGAVPRQQERKAIGLPPGHFDHRDHLPMPTMKQNLMAEPKFFPPTADTGLENIFGQVFSLRDRTLIPPPGEKLQPHITTLQPVSATRSNSTILFVAFSAFLRLLWAINDSIPYDIQSYILAGASLAPLVRLALNFRNTQNPVLLFSSFLEMLFVISLSGHNYISTHPSVLWDKIETSALSFCFLKEMYLYSTQQSTGPAQIPSASDTILHSNAARSKTPPIEPPVQQHQFQSQPPDPPTPTFPTSHPQQITRRRSSSSSTTSTNSITTTSTASAWKTPKPEARGFDFSSSSFLSSLTSNPGYSGFGSTGYNRTYGGPNGGGGSTDGFRRGSGMDRRTENGGFGMGGLSLGMDSDNFSGFGSGVGQGNTPLSRVRRKRF